MVLGKSVFAALLFAVTLAQSNEICAQLCVECSSANENPTCQRVDQVCGNCASILDSLQKVRDSLEQVRVQDSIVQARKLAFKDEQVRKLSSILRERCHADTNLLKVYIAGDTLKGIKQKKMPQATPAQPPAPEPDIGNVLQPISEECSNLCNSCEATSSDAMCMKIEEQCHCNAYAEQARLAREKAQADSIAAIEKGLADMEASLAAATRIFEFCNDQPTAKICSVMVVMKKEKFDIIGIKTLDPPPPSKPNMAVAMVKDSSAAKKDSSEKETQTKQKTEFQKGISFAYEHFQEKYVANYRVHKSPLTNFGLNLGYLARWNLYKWLSIQTGANAIFHYASYDIDDEQFRNTDNSISYRNIMLEVPLQIRFKSSLKNSNAKPFFSTSFHMRKPIFAWVDYDVERYWSGGGHYFNNGTEEGPFKQSDLEFLLFFGFGVEFTSHISLQVQLNVWDAVTYEDRNMNNYDIEGTWRINLDYAW